MASAIAVVWLLVVLGCAFFIIRPLPQVSALRTRWRAVGVTAFAFLVGGVAAGALMQLDPKFAAEKARDDAARAAKLDEDRQRNVGPKDPAQRVFNDRHVMLTKASEPCDDAMDKLGETLDGDKPKAGAAAAAHTAEDKCAKAAEVIKAIDYPHPIVSYARRDLSAAAQSCGEAYGMRAYAASKAAEAIEAKADAAALSDARDLYATAQNVGGECVNAYGAAVKKWSFEYPL
jgi:hypothetical protein